MDNAEFLSLLVSRLGCSIESASSLSDSFIQMLTHELDKGSTISIPDFGNLHVVKEDEHVVKSPVSNEPILMPPKLVPQFTPHPEFKEKLHII